MSEEELEQGGGEETPDVLEQAKAMGYNPDYDGDNKVSPEEFIARKPIYDTQRKLKRRIRDLETTISKQREVSEKLIEATRNEMLQKLEAEKKKAIEESNASAVLEADEKIAKVNEEYNTQKTQAQAQVPEVYQEFLDRNPWYEEDSDMQAWAEAAALKFKQSNPNATDLNLIKHVEERVKKVFPHKFEAAKPKTQEVEAPIGGGKRSASSDELGYNDIPKEFRQVAIEQWKAGAFKNKDGTIMSKNAAMKVYAQELKKIGAIE